MMHKKTKNVNQNVIVLIFFLLCVIIFVFSSGKINESKTVLSQYTIGVISPTGSMNISYLKTNDLALKHINDYCYTNKLDIVFEFKYDCAENKPQKALEITERFHEQGINIIVGYDWSSMLDTVDDYGKNMGIVMISPSGTNIHRDLYRHIFTMGPTEPTQMRALSLLITDCNVSRLIIFKPSFTKYSLFVEHLNASLVNDWVISEIVPYVLPSDYKVASKYIQNLEEAVLESMDVGETGVLFTGGAELNDIVTSALNNSVLNSVKWFATDQAFIKPSYINNKDVKNMKVFLLRDAQLDNKEYNNLSQIFEENYGENESIFQPYLYDSLWITALTLINTGTTQNETVINEFTAVAEAYEGVTGNCALDSNNERYSSTYQILYYTISDNHITLWKCGEVKSDESVKWLETAIYLE